MQLATGSLIAFEGDIIRWLDSEHRSIGFTTISFIEKDFEVFLYNANKNKLIKSFDNRVVEIFLGEEEYQKSLKFNEPGEIYCIPEEVLNEKENTQYNLLVKYKGIPVQLFWFYVKTNKEIEREDEIIIAEDIKTLVRNSNTVPTIVEFYASPVEVNNDLIPKKIQHHYSSGDYDKHRNRVNSEKEFYFYFKALSDGKPHEWKIVVEDENHLGLIKEEIFRTEGDCVFDTIITKVGLTYQPDDQNQSIYNKDLSYEPITVYRDNIKVAQSWVDITKDGKPSE